MANETVLILGGGVGGVTTAIELRKRLPRDRRVVLVDKTGQHLFQPSLLWLMTGDRQPDRIVRDLGVLERRGIELVRGTVDAIYPERRTVQVDGRELQGDALVIALGAQLAPERVPGLAEAGSTFYTLEGAQAIRDARRGFVAGRLAVVVAAMPFKCPAAPYEAALLL
ncbi:MAG: FAD-dependent oxidoreductase, partial [Chloroflexi bacterium]|nr:FAD-dependent oxidoreductase [Chloroflexota bacterium]